MRKLSIKRVSVRQIIWGLFCRLKWRWWRLWRRSPRGKPRGRREQQRPERGGATARREERRKEEAKPGGRGQSRRAPTPEHRTFPGAFSARLTHSAKETPGPRLDFQAAVDSGRTLI
ncbi:uncharacterized protein LOC108590573 [Callithrix jacchus]